MVVMIKEVATAPNLSTGLRFIAALTICFGLVVVANVSAVDTDPDGRLYPPSADPLADVQQALDRAADNDRLTLVVLGANWCHDSRALAARLHREPLANLIEQNYELVFVDAGHLDTGRSVLQEFGVANYYATPTVLIIDPTTGAVINNEDRHQWSNAFNIDMSESVQYFEKWMDAAPADAVEDSAELQQLLAEIDDFEMRMADRVSAGYAVVGPMLVAYEAGNPPDEFDARWNELRDFRVAIPGDVNDLKIDARQRVSAGEQNIQLDWPEYPPLSWESE